MPHSLPFLLPWGRNTVACVSQQQAERLVIFIHGFGGNSRNTWTGMEDLLDDDRAETADIIFYGYGSIRAPAQNSASEFRDFLRSVIEGSAAWANLLFRGGGQRLREYDDILIVAHSLGAVVARRALLDCLSQDCEWVSKSRLLLFGPAHMGTRLLNLAQTLKSGIGTLMYDVLTFGRVRVPVLDDLEPDSRFLQRLTADSKTVLNSGFRKPFKAEKVVFGNKDYVVLTEPFCDDPVSDSIPDHNHCSVCRTPEAVLIVSNHL